ncbi:hypothetical protein HZC27_03910 [Candidatus Roizmanbacteria bacterium]|nr:hypothetical protein [Candidatus Roizmanbacteria bacterium]
MKKYNSIIIAGSMSWDTIMDFPRRFVDFLAPEKLHQINVSFVVDNLEKQMGGTATNIAFAASQIKKILISHPEFISGSDSKQMPKRVRHDTSIYILGGLGKDGKDHLRFFKKNKIDTRGIVVDKNIFSANGSVITDIKDNQIWGFYYGACERGKDVEFTKFVRKDNLMIISANHPRAFLAAQKYAVKNKVDYLYDAGMSLTWITDKDLKQGVMNATYLIGNDYEIAMIIKRIKMTEKELVKKGVNVITTLGEKGVKFEGNPKSQILNPKQILNSKLQKEISLYIPAVKVHKVVDPTGAGDGFRGGFMVALALGYDMIDCLKVGNVVASFAIEKYGTVNYKMSKGEFEKRLRLISS